MTRGFDQCCQLERTSPLSFPAPQTLKQVRSSRCVQLQCRDARCVDSEALLGGEVRAHEQNGHCGPFVPTALVPLCLRAGANLQGCLCGAAV